MGCDEILEVSFCRPMAYSLTFSCYGSHLHGHTEGSIDRFHNIYKTPHLAPDWDRSKRMRKRLKAPPYLLGKARRRVVLQAIVESCRYRDWKLLAAHVRTTHVHVVMMARNKLETILRYLKSRASHLLSRSGLDDKVRRCRWSRHGSTKYLWRPEHIRASLDYVLWRQGVAMAVFVDSGWRMPVQDVSELQS